jgi:hypothetical protein
MSAIVDFLTGQGRDAAGRTLDQVLAFSDGELERHHDFIQWLFPLTEASAAVPGSPVLNPADVIALKASAEAQAHLAAAVARLGRFYDENDHWLRASDHNHLRITRIIKSQRMLCGDASADAFRARILKRAEATPVSATSRRYWDAA